MKQSMHRKPACSRTEPRVTHTHDFARSLGATQEGQSAPSLNRLMFVQTGFGCDQHGDRRADGATAAAVRACRNAIEFNSIPGMIDHVPGGRKNMLINVKLGVPEGYSVDLDQIRATFPYGRLLPVEIVTGGLTYGCGRVVSELGDVDDLAVIVVAAVSIGYHDPTDSSKEHKKFDTRDGH
mmetsp:Transcript_38097/g.87180  ORF Transcript_38097/g.87180 Transcript_38097/m.87180 type:complete len:181 (+) Transcript_38097:194-736(+)